MTETFIELTEDDFDDQFPLVPNHINPSAGWAVGDSGGCLFETFGEEFAFVRRHDPRKVWTLVDGDDGDMYVISGFHFVSRVGYLLSRDPVPDDTTIQVHLPMQDISDGDNDTLQPLDTESNLPAGMTRDHLAITPHATRNSDSLYSQTVSGRTVESTLYVAYAAGFDDYEIHGMRRLTASQEDEPAAFVSDDCEHVVDSEAQFWSLFGHIPGQGLECIGDFATREHAEEIYARITGRPYGRNGRSSQDEF